MNTNPESRSLAPLIDHTLLKPEARPKEIIRLCREAVEHGFATVCVNPCYVALAAGSLKGYGPKVCSVVDFPLGAGGRFLKVYSAVKSAEAGAAELDMVMSLGAFKAKEYKQVEEDVRQVKKALPGGAVLKIILETGLLSEDEIRDACRLSLNGGADFVKTSTGFGPSGATIEAVRIMKDACAGKMDVKASGGIRDAETARAMVAAGASRIGASASLRIIGVA